MEQQQVDKCSRKDKSRKTFLKQQKEIEYLVLIDELKKKGAIPIPALLDLIAESSSILANQPTLLRLPSPVTVIGDIHGQFYDLLNIFQKFGPAQNTSYLFLGDYVDRGKFCIEVMVLLLRLKCLFPSKIHLLRGNHQGRTMTTFFNFKLECEKKYNSEIYERFLQLFQKLPLCALIDNKYFAVHGGISPKLSQLYQIERIDRFVQISEELPMSDLLWSDPIDQHSDNWTYNKLRCCSYFYSPQQSAQFLKNNELKLIIRGHQVTAKGYKYQFNKNNCPLVLTVFSAPNYCDSYRNKAVAAVIKGDEIEIKAFKQVSHPFILENYMNVFDCTLPLITSNITQIFKYFVKVTQNKSTKRSSSQKRQDFQTILTIQHIEKTMSQNSLLILNFLFNHLKKQQNLKVISESESEAINVNSQQSQDLSEQMLLHFLSMKMNDQAQKMPITFGPRRIEFVRIKQKKKIDCPFEDDIEQQKLS